MARRGNSEGSIYQRGDNGLWVSVASLPGGKRKYMYSKTRDEAQRMLHAASAKIDAGLPATDSSQPLGQYLQRWLQDTVRPSVRPRTFETYEEKVRLHIAPEIGDIPLAKLRPGHVQRFYAEKLESGLSPATVQLIHAVLHRALKQAVRWELVPRNVADLVDPPRAVAFDSRPFSRDEFGVLLKAMEGHRHERLWTLMLATGVRFGEAAGLRWPDVDLDAKMIGIRKTLSRPRGGGWDLSEPKTAKGRREIPLPSIAVDALRAQRRAVMEMRLLAGQDWQDHEFVFPTSRGTPVRGTHVLKRFHDVLDSAGLERRRLHDLRHTYATTLFGLGEHPRVVQDLLGHSRISITMDTYTGSVPAANRAAATKLDQAFGGSSDQATA